MKMRPVLGACLAAMLFASCSNEDSVKDASSNEFSVITSIDGLSRAPQLGSNGAGTFTSGDQYSLVFSSTDGQNLIKTFDYTHNNTYYWADVQIPAGNKQAKIAAIYPTATVSSKEEAVNYKWNVTASNSTNDLLLATPAVVEINSATPVTLTFAHALHKFKVSLSGESKLTDGSTITCKNFLPIADVNLLTGTVKGASGSLKSTTVSGKTAEFIIPAQEVGTMAVVFHVDNKDYTFNLADCKVNDQNVTELKQGMSFELNVTVSKNGFTITGQNISAWGSQGTANGDIIL